MTVYIDVLVILNIYITYFTLRAAGRLLHTKPELRRLVIASVFGGVTSIAALADTDIGVSLLLKAALTAMTVLTAFGFGSLRLFAVRSFVSIAVSMLICGAAVLIHETSGSSFIFSANGYVYMGVSALVLVISSAVIYGVLSLFRRITDSPVADERVLVKIKNLGADAEINALADSGNFLRDFLTGRPVIVCREEAVRKIMPSNVAGYLGGCTSDMTGIRLIPTSTVSGSTVIAAFRPERVTVRFRDTEKAVDALIGVSDSAFGDGFDAVVSSKLIGS